MFFDLWQRFVWLPSFIGCPLAIIRREAVATVQHLTCGSPVYNRTLWCDVPEVLVVKALDLFNWFELSKTHLLMKNVFNFYDFNKHLSGLEDGNEQP